ncbi:TetR/AcrR family transcriptional regulator [Micromonospora sp. LOL_024]|uniref:TetR/AcrR family transcriptional regulator n=1 Tax=Micromonospora sp. LOL_024 TaxID=3345412 RepID=UPI003A89B162
MVTTEESGSRARTRQAILQAAIEVLSRNPAASLGEIATAANVGRTTLHRYFAERSDLLAGVIAEGVARLNRATTRARLGSGSGAEALHRLCAEYFDLGDLLSLIFADPQLVADPAWATQVCDADFHSLVARGHADGSIDPALPSAWVQSVLWAQLYAGWSYLTEHDVSRQEVLGLVTHTVAGAVALRR